MSINDTKTFYEEFQNTNCHFKSNRLWVWFWCLYSKNLVSRPFHLLWSFHNYHCRYWSLYIMVAYYWSLCIPTFHLCRLFFSSSEKKPWIVWLPLGYNHSSKSWSRCPWSWISPSIRVDSFKYLPTEYYQHRSVESSFTTKYYCEYLLLTTNIPSIPIFYKCWLINGLSM